MPFAPDAYGIPRRFALGLAAAAPLPAARDARAQAPLSGPAAPAADPVPTRFAAPAPSAAFGLPTRYARVHGTGMAYYEVGEGRPVLFLHGLPTWSYLWRNVLPLVASGGHRAIALDLLGFGRSGRPDGLDLGYAEQVRHLDGFVAALGLRDLALVLHD